MLEKIKQQIPPLIDFVKKHRLTLSIMIVVIILFTAIFIAIPVINVNGLKLVNQNVPVRVEPGQTVRLKGGSVLLRIQRFISDSCPQDQKCFGSQQINGVIYDTQINGHRLNTYSFSKIPNSNYQIETLSSDYKTYADIRIVSSR